MSDKFLIKRAASVITKIINSHEKSTVDWDAMKQAKHLLPMLKNSSSDIIKDIKEQVMIWTKERDSFGIGTKSWNYAQGKIDGLEISLSLIRSSCR